jgi:large subunit ribosomal protein L17
MRHGKDTCKLSRTSSHRRALFANMVKSLILHGRIETTVPKAKALKRVADKMVTYAKENTLATKRRAISAMMIRYNKLTPKEARAVKGGDTSAYNGDRLVVQKLFGEIGPRFQSRKGGYTRLLRTGRRVGDNAPTCLIEFLPE